MNEEQTPNRVSLGCWVKVTEEGTTEEEVFQIVESAEANVLENRIPPDTPMARALLGAEPGDTVGYDAPKGRIEFTVLDVGRN